MRQVTLLLAFPSKQAYVTGHDRQRNLQQLSEIALHTGWQSVVPADSFCTGILLLELSRSHVRQAPSRTLRQAFSEHGIALMAYEQGTVRLSMSAVEFRSDQYRQLETALRSVA